MKKKLKSTTKSATISTGILTAIAILLIIPGSPLLAAHRHDSPAKQAGLQHASAHKQSVQKNSTVRSYRLKNGLRVLVIENHRAPVVVSQLWYKVGSSYEHGGITGLSHIVEHMMFKGTPRYPAGKFSEIIAANGGSENAFTGQDYTAYFQQISNTKLALCFKLEADRMQHLSLKAADFRKEIEVVKEERRMRTDDKPAALLNERFNAVAFTSNAYHHPVIGWMEDLNAITVQDVRKWYHSWYAPNNATLVVDGDVKAKAVFALAKKYFGVIPVKKLPGQKPRHEVKQYGTKRITVEKPAKVPYLMMGYKVPVLLNVKNKADVYALDVLAGILDGGDSARLSKDLVRGQQIATSASAGYSMNEKHETLFTLSALPAKGAPMAKLEAALRKEVKTAQTTLVDKKELERVKAQVVATNIYQQDSSFYQAMQVGMLETVGLPWQTKDNYIKAIQAVTAKQVRQVAKKYLLDTGLTVGVLKPLPINAKQKAMLDNGAPMGGGYVH